MQHVSEIMSYDVAVVSPSDSLTQAIQIMTDWNISAVPVCDNGQIAGILSKTDIAEQIPELDRALADISVSEIMTHEMFYCFKDQPVEEVLHQMIECRVRHLPVFNRQHELAGIVSLTDLANRVAGYSGDMIEKADEAFGEHALSSSPTRAYRPLSDSVNGNF